MSDGHRAFSGWPEGQPSFTGLFLSAQPSRLAIVAILPAVMFCCYLALVLYFISRGGYKAQHLEMSGEKASGGVEGPVEA